MSNDDNGDDEERAGKPKTALKLTLATILGGIGTTILAAIVGVLTSAYVEISFKDPWTVSWRDWMDLHADLIKPKIFYAFYGNNDNGKTVRVRALFSLRFFGLTHKILGTKVRSDDQRSYDLVGFWKDEQLALAHRARTSGGQAVFLLKLFSSPGITEGIYAGYVVVEDWKYEDGREDWIIKCPILLIKEEVAKYKYPDIAPVERDFPFITSKCVEFPMPTSVKHIIADEKPIDEILKPKQ